MTDHSDPRALLLERLESRCMLAAGLFAHSVDHDGERNQRGDVRGHGDGKDASGVRHAAEIRKVGEAGNHDHRPARDPHHRNRVDHGRSNRSASPTSSPPQQQVFRGSSITDNGFQPLENHREESQFSTPVVSSAAASTSNPLPTNASALGSRQALASGNQPNSNQRVLVQNVSQSNTIQNESSIAADESAAASGEAVLSAINAQGQSDSSEAATDRVFDIAFNLRLTESASESLRFNANRTGNFDRFIDQSIRDMASDSPSTLDRVWDGFIEPRFGLRSEWLQAEASSDEATWEIHRDTLNGLQELAADPSEEQASDSFKLTDQVIGTWFEGKGGLVDVGLANFGSGHAILAGGAHSSVHPGDFVGIALDATVGLHRSASLISDDLALPDATVSDGEAIRDAVLAAIAGEASSPVSPIGGEARPKLSSIAYPGAVILASTLAIIGRRKTAKLFNHSRRRPKSRAKIQADPKQRTN